MRSIIALLFIAGVTQAREIKVDFPYKGARPGATRLFIEQEGKKFSCRTQDVPKHGIRVRWLKSLETPRTLEPFDRQLSCPERIVWNGQKRCVGVESRRQIKDLVRWCTQI